MGISAMEMEQLPLLAAAFYPEHMDETLWEPNVADMAENGITAVRLGEFCWDRFEPEEGKYDFSWMNRLLDLLDKYKMYALMCTPTASPPYWICKKYPEILPKTQDGSVIGFGGRRHVCYTSPKFRELSRKITAAMGREYGQRKTVIAWQIDNEIGDPDCYCEQCEQAYREFVESKFKTIDNYNNTMFSAFWAQTLTDFSHVALPRVGNNPIPKFTFRKFVSRQWISLLKEQKEALRNEDAEQPVSTNMMTPWFGYDHIEMAEYEEVLGFDHYPSGHPYGEEFDTIAFFTAFHRGMKNGQNVWVWESQVNSRGQALMLPGMLRAWSWYYIGLGVDLISYFRWNQPAGGNEIMKCGLSMVRGGKLRQVEETRQLGMEIRQVKNKLAGSSVPSAEIGVLFSWLSWWDDLGPESFAPANPPVLLDRKVPGLAYPYHHFLHFTALSKFHRQVDIVFRNADFSKYRVIVAPTLTCLDKETADKLREFVSNGGTLLCVGMCGRADENNLMFDELPPGILTDLLGVEIIDWGKKCHEYPDLQITRNGKDSTFPELKVMGRMELCNPLANTETLAGFKAPLLRKYSAFTRKVTGKGAAYFLSVHLDDDGMKSFYHWWLPSVGIDIRQQLPEGIRYGLRRKDGQGIMFLINSTPYEKVINLQDGYFDLIADRQVSGKIIMPPYDVKILSEKI
jgi:beta-galactosidase